MLKRIGYKNLSGSLAQDQFRVTFLNCIANRSLISFVLIVLKVIGGSRGMPGE